MVLKSKMSSPTKGTGHSLIESLKRTVSPPSHPLPEASPQYPDNSRLHSSHDGELTPLTGSPVLGRIFSPTRNCRQLSTQPHPPWPPEPLGKDCWAAPKRPNSKAWSYSPDSWNGKVEEHRLGARKIQIQILTPLFI